MLPSSSDAVSTFSRSIWVSLSAAMQLLVRYCHRLTELLGVIINIAELLPAFIGATLLMRAINAKDAI